MKIVKIILLNLVFFSYLDAGDYVQKIINVEWSKDISKRACRGDCGSDRVCQNTKSICEIMLKLPIDTIDQEIFTKSLRVVSSAVTGVLNKAVEKKILKFNDVVGFYTILDDALPTYYGSKKFPNKAKIFNGPDVVEFFIDTAIDIFIEYKVNKMTHDDLAFFRLINDNAPDETLRQAAKWMMTLAKNDAKAWAVGSMGDFSGAVRAGVLDNGFLLLDIGIKTTSAAQDWLDAKVALAKSKKTAQMMNLYYNMESSYFKSTSLIDKSKKLKEFEEQCNAIKLDFGEFVTANWAKINQQYGASINQELRIRCDEYKQELIIKDIRKNNLTITNIKKMTKQQYIKMINYYYPDSQYNYYINLYDVVNYDPEIGVNTKSSTYKYLKQLRAYGLIIPKEYLDPTKNISMSLASDAIRISLKHRYGVIKKSSEIFEDAGYTQNTTLTRKRYSKLLVDNLRVANVKLDKNPKATFIQWTQKHRPYYDARLAAHDVIKVDNDNTVYALASSQTVKSYTLVQMLADTLDVVTCGHKGCSYEEILKESK